MLDKNVFKEQMERLSILYPNWKFDKSDKVAAGVWYNEFKKFDDERFKYMINGFVNYEKFNPTVASLKGYDTMPRKSIDQIKHEKMLEESGFKIR